MDTTTASKVNYSFIYLGALAQFERSLIQERVKAGLEAAKIEVLEVDVLELLILKK